MQRTSATASGGDPMPNGAERLRRIGELARSVSSTLDLKAVLDHVTAGVSALRPDAACSVRLIDPVAGGYSLARAGGVRIVGRRQVIPFGRGLTHAVAETERPYSWKTTRATRAPLKDIGQPVAA